jgi:hypothetical protein
MHTEPLKFSEKMRNVYYSIFYIHYKIFQVGRGGKLWSASSSSLLMSLIITLCLHFIIGRFIGRKLMHLNNSTFYGTVVLFAFIIFNFILFVRNSNYLKIELEYENNKSRLKKAVLYTFLYYIIVIIIF